VKFAPSLKFIKSRVLKNFLIYAFGAFLIKGASVFIAPIVMRILTPEDYGLLALVTSFINILFTCAGLGLRQFLTIEYFHCDAYGRKKIINDMIAIYLLMMIPVFILLFFSTGIINRIVFVNQAYTSLIVFCLLLAFIKFFVELFYQILQYTGRAFTLTLVQLFSALIIISLNLSFLYFLRWGVFSVVAAQLVSVSVVLLIAIFFYINQFYHLYFDISCSISKSWWYIKRGLPFVPRVLFAWILAVGDRWVLAKYASFADVGIYSVADMFGQLFQMIIILPLSYAYYPYLMKKFAANKDKLLKADNQNYKTMVVVMIFLFFLVTIGFTLFKPLICIVIPKNYHGALQYIWFLLIGYIFFLGTYFSTGFLSYQKRIYFLVFALLVPAIFNIVLNIFLIPIFKIWGCVFATVLSYFLYFVITVIYNFYVRRSLAGG